jgi:hypothetical protein
MRSGQQYKYTRAVELAEEPPFAGCKTRVDLGREFSAADARPVLADEAFQREAAAVRAAI